MEISPRYELKPDRSATVTMRKINGKRFTFRRFESADEVTFHVTHYSTRHWIVFPKEKHDV